MSLGIALALILGYALGSIPVAALVGEFHGLDPYEAGAGGTDGFDLVGVLGLRRALPAFAGEAFLGLLAGLLGLVLGGTVGAYLAVTCAILGHSFSMFTDFRGGRAVMTFAGGAIALSAGAALISLLAGGLAWFVTSRFRTGARTALFGFPVVELFVDPRSQLLATCVVMSIVGLRFLAVRRRAARTPVPVRAVPPMANVSRERPDRARAA